MGFLGKSGGGGIRGGRGRRGGRILSRFFYERDSVGSFS